MFNVNLILGSVAALVVFGLGLGAGYKWESGRVAELEKQLSLIEMTAKNAEAKLKRSQQDIDAKLAEKDAEYKQKMDALQQSADAKHKQLEEAIAGKDQRIADLKNQMGPLNANLKALREQQKNAPASDQATLQSKIDQLVEERKALKQQTRGENCVTIPVPKQYINALNGVKS
jgi:chromosome segregation ATPase